MPIKILMPALSPTMKEGNLTKWLKKEGDVIKAGQVIAEIETDKATMEVEAVDEGILGKIFVKEGSQNVPVNNIIALLLEEGEDASNIDNFKMEVNQGIIKQKPKEEIDKKDSLKKDVALHGDRIIASPLAKKIAEINSIDLKKIKGTGPYGRIIKADLANKNNVPQKNNLSRNSEEYIILPHSNIRKIIATRLLESKQMIPHFYLSIECKMDKLLDIRKDMNDESERLKSNKLSVNDYIILASARTLREVKEVNSSWSDDGIVQYNNIDISIAVAINEGLITPIIKNTDQKNIYSISAEMKELASKARDNKLSPEEFQGGNFTISNLGMYDIKNFAAIINPPQSCIMAVGASVKRAIIDNDKIAIATMMEVTLSCDHRIVDGVVGAKFLQIFKRFIENPILLFV